MFEQTQEGAADAAHGRLDSLFAALVHDADRRPIGHHDKTPAAKRIRSAGGAQRCVTRTLFALLFHRAALLRARGSPSAVRKIEIADCSNSNAAFAAEASAELRGEDKSICKKDAPGATHEAAPGVSGNLGVPPRANPRSGPLRRRPPRPLGFPYPLGCGTIRR